jgi:hypothetical protein
MRLVIWVFRELMAKTLLSLALLTTQLLSWGASPLYLCLCEDGGVCIDRGPRDCGCCSCPADDPHQCLADSEDCHEHDSDLHRSPSSSAVTPDGHASDCCTHIQISQSQSPVVTVASASADAIQQFVPLFADVICILSAGGTEITSTALDGPPPDSLWGPLRALATVVIRC